MSISILNIVEKAKELFEEDGENITTAEELGAIILRATVQAGINPTAAAPQAARKSPAKKEIPEDQLCTSKTVKGFRCSRKAVVGDKCKQHSQEVPTEKCKYMVTHKDKTVSQCSVKPEAGSEYCKKHHGKGSSSESKPKCKGATKAGKPCSRDAVNDCDGYCTQHFTLLGNKTTKTEKKEVKKNVTKKTEKESEEVLEENLSEENLVEEVEKASSASAVDESKSSTVEENPKEEEVEKELSDDEEEMDVTSEPAKCDYIKFKGKAKEAKCEGDAVGVTGRCKTHQDKNRFPA